MKKGEVKENGDKKKKDKEVIDGEGNEEGWPTTHDRFGMCGRRKRGHRDSKYSRKWWMQMTSKMKKKVGCVT